jgi:hypothetical protein
MHVVQRKKLIVFYLRSFYSMSTRLQKERKKQQQMEEAHALVFNGVANQPNASREGCGSKEHRSIALRVMPCFSKR